VFDEVHILFHFNIWLLCCFIAKESNHIAGEERMFLRTPWSRVVLEKLTGFQLDKFPAFYETRRFITAFTSAGEPIFQ